MIDRCAIYARYSTDLQTDNSIAYQFNAIRNYCKNNGLLIVDEFYDEAMSGTNIDRPDFLKMREKALKGFYDAIVIYDITRLSRNVGDWMQFHQQMTDAGVKILSPTQQVGSFYNPSDFLMGGINALIGEHFVLVTREKSMAGLKETAKKGKFNGGMPPYGYDIKNGKYVINQFESNIVKKIFEMYAAGEYYSKIVKTANEMGYTGRKGAKLSQSQINSMLSNERYTGTYIWNQYQHHKMSRKIPTPKKKEESEIIKIDNGIPAIISNDIWTVCQQRLSGRMAKFASNKDYPLKGLIYCGECGNAYRGEININTRGYGGRYYRCGGKRDKKIACNNIGVRAEVIEKFAKDAVYKQFVDSDYEKIVNSVFDKMSRIITDTNKVKEEIKEIDGEFNNITNAISQGIIYDGLIDKVNLLKKKRLVLVEKLKQEKSSPFSKQAIKDKLLALRNKFIEYRDDDDNYYILARNVIEKIIVQPTGLIFIYIKNVVLKHSEERIRTADLSGMNRTL